MIDQQELFPGASYFFGPRFLHDHAGRIMSDPRIAVVELVANSYDAGASMVKIAWPTAAGEKFSLQDNGTGMSIEEFNTRWRTLSYSRIQEQGIYVDVPPGVRNTKRIAFGQNGKGRYGPFCFADEYDIETWKNGICIQARISLAKGSNEPFHCDLLPTSEKSGHGTCVSALIHRNSLPVDGITDAIGSKFIIDPSFSIEVNGKKIELLNLSGIATSSHYVDQYGNIKIHQIDALVQDRTKHLRGITWWVNRRMVGNSSWDGLDGSGAILDGRTALAKRLSFIVEADFLKEDVKDDWTGFHDSQRMLAARRVVNDCVSEALYKALADTKKSRKRAALENSRDILGRLPALSKKLVGQFVDEVQQKCPTLSQGDLARTAAVFANMEIARSGYELLEKLAVCLPEDIDTWNRLMEEWSASNAEIVLSELKRRLDLIERLMQLVNVETTDELHELQPLFARGLWMFGPEYESIDFSSNRTITTIIRNLLGGASEYLSSRRPDVVALPDRSICCYAADRFDSAGEVDGIGKVLIVELKKGGFTLGTAEIRQGEDYALAIQRANHVSKTTEIVVYVLGAKLSDDAAEERTAGKIRIIPMTYDTILKRAHARTFNLQRRLISSGVNLTRDEDVDDVVGMPLLAMIELDRVGSQSQESPPIFPSR